MQSENVRVLQGVFDFLTDTNQKIWFFGLHSIRLEKTINVLYNNLEGSSQKKTLDEISCSGSFLFFPNSSVLQAVRPGLQEGGRLQDPDQQADLGAGSLSDHGRIFRCST